MARLYTEGFESGTGGWNTTNGSPTIVGTQFNSGANSLRCNPTAGVASITKTIAGLNPASPNEHVYMRAYIYVASAPSARTAIMAFADNVSGATGFFCIKMNTDRTMTIGGSGHTTGTASAAVPLNTWTRIEFDYDDGANTLVGYLNGTQWASITGADLSGGTQARWGVIQTATADIYFDDCALNDPSGGSDNGLPGAVNSSVPISGADTGSSAEAGSVAATLPGTDTGSGASGQAIAASLSGSDTGAGTSGQSIGFSAGDAGSGASAQTVSPLVTDTGSGTSGQSISAALSSADTGTFVDAQSVSGGTTPGGADTSAGVSAQSIAASQTQADLLASLEAWSIQVFVPQGKPQETLVQGPATLWLGAYGALEPGLANVGSPPDEGVWTDLGGLKGGVDLTMSEEYKEIVFDQLPDTPIRRLEKRYLSVKTEMAEPTLINLAYALNDTTGVTGQAYTPTVYDAATQLPYRALIVDGWAPGFNENGRHKRRRIIVRKCLSIDNITMAYTKDGQTTYSVNWSCHYVDGSTAPFRIIDEA